MKAHQITILVVLTSLEIVAFLLYQQQAEADFQARLAAEKMSTRPVLFAARDIEAAQPITESMIVTIDTQTNILQNAITQADAGKVIHGLAYWPIRAGAPLTTVNVSLTGEIRVSNWRLVLFATQDIAPGQIITPDLLIVKRTPRTILQGAYTKDNVDRVVRCVARYPIFEGDALTSNNLVLAP